MPDFPESTFELTGIKPASGGTHEVSGNLTLIGNTKNISFPASASVADGKAEIRDYLINSAAFWRFEFV